MTVWRQREDKLQFFSEVTLHNYLTFYQSYTLTENPSLKQKLLFIFKDDYQFDGTMNSFWYFLLSVDAASKDIIW